MALTRATDKIIANADGNLNLSGIVTATSFSGSGANLTGIDDTAIKFGSDVKVQANNSGATVTGILTVSSNLSVGGTITYEDVTNVDSVGVITARNGIKIGPAAGVAGTFFADGSYVTAGIITATSFSGSGANLTSLPAQATIANNADNRVITGGSGVNLNAESNVLYDGTNFGIGKSPSRTLDVQGKIRSSDSVCFGDNSSTPSEGAAIHRPAASTLAFVTNNTERLRIDSSGDILFLGSTLRIKDSGNSAQRGAIYGDASSFHINAGVNNLVAYSAGTERLRIDSSGRVLIATTSGSQGQVSIKNANDFSTASVSTNTDNIFLISDATSGNGVYGASIGFSRVQYADRRAAAIATVQQGSDEDNVGLAFFTHPSSNATDPIVEKLRITSGGQTRMNPPAVNGSHTLISEKQALIGTKHFYSVFHTFSGGAGSINSPLAVNSKIPTNTCGTVEIMAGWGNGNGLRYQKYSWIASGATSITQRFNDFNSRYGVSVSVSTPTMSISGDYVNFSFAFSDSQGSKMENLKIHFEYFHQFRVDG